MNNWRARILYRLYFFVAVIVGMSASFLGCTSVRQSVPAEQSDLLSTDDVLAPHRNPFHLNPVSWRYLSVVAEGDEIISDTYLAMTTTRERESLDDLGLLFKLIVEVQGPGPESERRGVAHEGGYLSLVALQTSAGLYTGRPSPEAANLSNDADEISTDLLSGSPAWPLGNARGCRYYLANLELAIGSTRGVITHCENYASHVGQADVTTAWVDQVGFVYRRADPVDNEDNSLIFLDYLVDGDLAELAPLDELGAAMFDFRPGVSFEGVF